MKISADTESRIVKIDNAFILQRKEYFDEQEQNVETSFSFEEDADTTSMREAFVRLVYALAEHYGFTNDNYGEHNLDVNFNKKGRKVE